MNQVMNKEKYWLKDLMIDNVVPNKKTTLIFKFSSEVQAEK